MLTPAVFRQQFNEFNDAGVYTDPLITFFITLAVGDPTAGTTGLLNSGCVDRWQTTIDYATALFVAHHLAIAAKDTAAAKRGGIPGQVQGVLTAKSVDKVSASYSAESVSLSDAGFWNMSTYGIRFLQLARMVGSGGVQI